MDGTVDLLTIVMALGAIWTVVVLVHRGSAFWTGDLDTQDQQLAAAVALFLVIPVGVLLHELGHALATWSIDGQVTDFRWRVSAGSVTAVGLLSELEWWWITVSGNVVGTAFAFLLLAVAYVGNALRRPLRYIVLVGGVLGVLFALIGYPLLSLSGAYEDTDWTTIYDFSATPAASAATAVVHAALLGGLWAVRRRLDDLGFGLTSGTLDEVRRLREAIAAEPEAVDPRVSLALHFARYRAADRAEREAEQALRRCGEHALPYVPLVLALFGQGRYEEAVERIRRAKELAVRDRMQVTGVAGDEWMQGRLGIVLAAAGRNEEAVEAFSKLSEPMASDDDVKRWRAKALAGSQLPQPEADA